MYWRNIILLEIKSVYNKKFLENQIQSYSDEAAVFLDKGITKPASDCTCLAVIKIDSALKKEENHYPQAFSKECKYIQKEVIRHIIEDIEDFLATLTKNRLRVNIVVWFLKGQFLKCIV